MLVTLLLCYIRF